MTFCHPGRYCRFCRKVWYLGQNGKTDRNYFKNLQRQKLTKNKLCDRTESPNPPALDRRRPNVIFCFGQEWAIIQIEDIAAVNNIDEILSTPGVDLIFLGMFDLSASLGLLGQVADPKVEEAAHRVLTAAKRAKIPVGIIALSPEDINRRITQGYQFIAVSTHEYREHRRLIGKKWR